MDKYHFQMLQKGVDIWNKWRQENSSIMPDLSEADLSGANLSGADLSGAVLFEAFLGRTDLTGANLTKADLSKANLTGANLTGANLFFANLHRAYLGGADLTRANLRLADLSLADLTAADLTGTNLGAADLSKTRIIDTRLKGATLTDCRVFGINAWGLIDLEEAEQSNLMITPHGEPVISVDNLEVAQFIYTLLNGKKIRTVIDSITGKVVLILGRFIPERKAELDVIREGLRKRNYLPILFDFDKPASRNMTDIVSTLAHMARFIIVDITDPRSVPHELTTIIPNLLSVPVQPIILSSAREHGIFADFKIYPWILKIHRYNGLDDLIKSVEQEVIVPAENRAKELQKRYALRVHQIKKEC